MEEHFKDKVGSFKFLNKGLKACVENGKLIQQGKYFKVAKEVRSPSQKRQKKIISIQPENEQAQVMTVGDSDEELNKTIDDVINKVTLPNQEKGKPTVQRQQNKTVKRKVKSAQLDSNSLNGPARTKPNCNNKDQAEQSLKNFFEYVDEKTTNNQKMGKCLICLKVARTDSLKKHIKTTHKNVIKGAIKATETP